MNKILFISSNNMHVTILKITLEHRGVSVLTGKRITKKDNNSFIRKHQLFCNHSSNFDNFYSHFGVLHRQQWQTPTSTPVNYIKGECFHYQRQSSFEQEEAALPLELFDD